MYLCLLIGIGRYYNLFKNIELYKYIQIKIIIYLLDTSKSKL